MLKVNPYIQATSFTTANYGETNSGPGVCMALSCKWLARIIHDLQNGNDPTKSAVYETRSVVQHQQTYEDYGFDELALAQSGLKSVWNDDGHNWAQARYNAEQRKEYDQLPCYLLTIMGAKGGHAMALYENEEGRSIFFDPNEGATLYTEKHDLSKAIAFELEKYNFLQPHTVAITNVEALTFENNS